MKQRGARNLLYFGDIATHTIKEYKAAMEDHYVASGKLTAQYFDDLLVQIHVNSSITHRKMRLFQFGAMLFGAAITVVGLAVAIWAVRTVLV